MAKVTNLSKLSEQSVPQAALKLKKKKVAPQHLHKSHIYKSQNHWEFRKKMLHPMPIWPQSLLHVECLKSNQRACMQVLH